MPLQGAYMYLGSNSSGSTLTSDGGPEYHSLGELVKMRMKLRSETFLRLQVSPLVIIPFEIQVLIMRHLCDFGGCDHPFDTPDISKARWSFPISALLICKALNAAATAVFHHDNRWTVPLYQVPRSLTENVDWKVRRLALRDHPHLEWFQVIKIKLQLNVAVTYDASSNRRSYDDLAEKVEIIGAALKKLPKLRVLKISFTNWCGHWITELKWELLRLLGQLPSHVRVELIQWSDHDVRPSMKAAALVDFRVHLGAALAIPNVDMTHLTGPDPLPTAVDRFNLLCAAEEQVKRNERARKKRLKKHDKLCAQTQHWEKNYKHHYVREEEQQQLRELERKKQQQQQGEEQQDYPRATIEMTAPHNEDGKRATDPYDPGNDEDEDDEDGAGEVGVEYDGRSQSDHSENDALLNAQLDLESLPGRFI